MLFRFLNKLLWLALAAAAAGCGSTRWSDTARTATEQLLLSDAIDRAVSQMDFAALAGRDVYLDGKYLTGMVDEKYVMSTLRQHMFASGCCVKDKPDEATFICEVRAGALGTNRSDLLFGMPATSLPAGGAVFPVAPASIPELPLIKRTAQAGVCKIAVFAYDRSSGQPVWQSGTRQQMSKAKDVWVFGTGPFQRGTIYEGTKFAGERLEVPLAGLSKPRSDPNQVWVGHEILFQRPSNVAAAPGPARTAAASTPSDAAAAPAPAPPDAGPPPSVVFTATAGGPTQAAYVQPAPPVPAQGQSSSNSTSAPPNPAAGAFGAMQAVDWARTLRNNYGTANPAAGSAAGSVGSPMGGSGNPGH